MTIQNEPKTYDSVLSAIKESPENIGSGSFWGHRVVVVKSGGKWKVVSKNFLQQIFYYIFQASTSKNTLNNELKKAESINLNDDQFDKIKAAVGFILGIKNTSTLKEYIISNQLEEIFKGTKENILINNEEHILAELQKLKDALPDVFSFTTYDPETLGQSLLRDPSFLKYVPQNIEIKVGNKIEDYAYLIEGLLENILYDDDLVQNVKQAISETIKSCLSEGFILKTNNIELVNKVGSLNTSFPIEFKDI